MDKKGYIVPAPIDPHELICFHVYVPKDTLYIGAFWSAYQHFTSWLAWAKDPLKKGKAAAAVWREAYDKARAEFEITKGVCEMNITGLRQNPNDPCQLQVEFDGNNQWQTVADLSKCSSCGGAGAFQFDGTNVNSFDSCSGQFVPSSEPFDPTKKGIYDHLYAPDQSGACNGAANIAAYLKYVSDQSLTMLATGGFVGQVANFIIGTFGFLTGAGVLTELFISTLLAEITTYSTLLSDAAALDISADMQTIIYHHINTDGTLREPNFTEMVAEMFAMRDAQTPDTAERVRWGHETNIASLVGPYLISRQNKYAGITSADCSTEGWSHTFDLTDGKHGWFNIPELDNLDGEWVSGQGWKPTIGEITDGRTVNTVRLQSFIPSRTITHIEYTYSATIGDDDSNPVITDCNFIGYGTDDLALYHAALITGTDKVIAWSGSQVMSEIRVGMQVAMTFSPPLDVEGGGKITRINIRGEGVDPF